MTHTTLTTLLLAFSIFRSLPTLALELNETYTQWDRTEKQVTCVITTEDHFPYMIRVDVARWARTPAFRVEGKILWNTDTRLYAEYTRKNPKSVGGYERQTISIVRKPGTANARDRYDVVVQKLQYLNQKKSETVECKNMVLGWQP